ncbi:MAG: outer membrane protein assembly factor BamB family protein [Phycisphaerales bacterium]
MRSRMTRGTNGSAGRVGSGYMGARVVAACLGGALASGGSAALGSEILWTTNPDMPTVYSAYLLGPSVSSPVLQGEVADDFNVFGTIEHILADGETCINGCFGTPDGVTGVFVRFYEWTEAGPGGLLDEQFVALNDGFTYSPSCCMELLDITLPEPFVSSGLHYVSVQVALDGMDSDDQWNFYRRNVNQTMGGPAYYRDLNGDGAWTRLHTQEGWPPVDMSFQLSGTVGGQPEPNILFLDPADGVVNPSDRLLIHGVAFGNGVGTNQVLIGGEPGIVTSWTDQTITVYVPESVGFGPAEVSLKIGGEIADSMDVTVVEREGDGRVLWYFEGDGPYSTFRPSVGPDGTVYVDDVRGRLYALDPDGGLKWTVDALRGAQGSGDEGPIAVGGDGTIYVGTNPLGQTVRLEAFNPDGTHKWTFTIDHALTWQAGPSIGPDGKIYGAMNAGELLGNAFDVFAVNPDGSAAWTTTADPFVFEDAAKGSEMAFIPSSPGGAIDQLVFTADRNGDGRNWGFDLASGDQNFATPIAGGNDVGQTLIVGDPETGTHYMMEFGGIGGVGWGLQSFEPSGDRSWRFDPGIASGATRPAIGADGSIYLGWDLLRLSAVNPDGGERWRTVRDSVSYQGPIPSPSGDAVLALGNYTDPVGSGSFVELRAADDGEQFWTQDVMDEDGTPVTIYTKPRFSTDGQAAYVIALELPITPVSTYRVIAFDVSDEVGGPAGDLNGDGWVDSTDLGILLGAFGTTGAGDVNGDGATDSEDLGILLSAFGTGG